MPRHGLGLPFCVRPRSALGPGLCTALPRSHNVSFHAQLSQELSDLSRMRTRHAPPSCPLHGPAVASPLAPYTAPPCTYRPVHCSAPPHTTLLSVARPLVLCTFRALPCDGLPGPFRAWPRRERALPFRVRPRRCICPPVCARPGRVIITPRSMHSSARHLPTCSMFGPASHHPLVCCTAPP